MIFIAHILLFNLLLLLYSNDKKNIKKVVCHQGHEQLLCLQIPKAQKRQSSCQYFFVLLGPACAKAAHKRSVKLTPAIIYH